MDTKYFKLWYKLGSHDAYLIWRSNSEDGVVVDSNGRVPSFANIDQLFCYAHKLGIELVDEEPILHNLDLTVKWLGNKDGLVDCDNLLLVWNLFRVTGYVTQSQRFDRGIVLNIMPKFKCLGRVE